MPNQAFLGDRSHQLPSAIEHAATGKTTRVAGPRAVHRVKQPVIGTQVIVEPQRVIKAGNLLLRTILIETAQGFGRYSPKWGEMKPA